jgi:Zn-finger nucleic acid-binding protein
MKCPVCADQVLAMSERQGVEIDYCPGCRGVWLDRGELDKLIEKSESATPPPAPAPRAESRSEGRSDGRYDDRYDKSYDKGYDDRRPKKKKSSFLSEIMDF